MLTNKILAYSYLIKMPICYTDTMKQKNWMNLHEFLHESHSNWTEAKVGVSRLIDKHKWKSDRIKIQKNSEWICEK